MSYRAKHDLQLSKYTDNSMLGKQAYNQVTSYSLKNGGMHDPVQAAPFDLNSISGYTYNSTDEVHLNIPGVDPGYGKFTKPGTLVFGTGLLEGSGGTSCYRQVGPKSYRPFDATFCEVNLSTSGVLTTTFGRHMYCQASRGQRWYLGPYPDVRGLMNIHVFRFGSSGVTPSDLKWVYVNQPDLTTRGVTTGQPPDLVAIDIKVKKSDVVKWSYEIGQKGYDLNTQTYGGEFDVNRGDTARVYQVRAGDDSIVLKGKDSPGNVRISTSGAVKL